MRKDKLRIALTLFVICAVFMAAVTVTANLIANPGFQGSEGMLPSDWMIFSGALGRQLLFVEDDENPAQKMLLIDDPSSSHGYGLRSAPISAETGKTYVASVKARTEQGGSATLYLDFWDRNKKRIVARTASHTGHEWQTLSASMEAPPEAVWVSIILYSSINAEGRAYFKEATLLESSPAAMWTDDDVNLTASEGQLDYAPADGSVVATNPPSFIWIPVAGAKGYLLEYSTDEDFAPEKTKRVENIDISIYTPPELLDPAATWYWRVRAVDQAGDWSPPTISRAFRIAQDAMPLPLPPLDEVRRRIATDHPRLFVTSDTLENWRQKAQSDLLHRTLWSQIRNQALTASVKPLPDEPPHCRPGGVRDINLWRQYTITVEATDDMEVLAFAYLMTGDPRFGEAARRLMLHLAGWEPNGATSWSVNSENFMPILLKLSRAYTWAYDALSPEDRQIIKDVMRIRGEAAYRVLAGRPYESRPYSSHPGRMLGFLGEAAIAFLGEIPEAEKWFDYIVRIFYAVYPAWGADAGGWAEGHSYWTSYINRALAFVDALWASTGLSLYEKPFFRNTGMFKLYTQPPYSKMGPFGDFYDAPPSSAAGSVMAHFAKVYDNEYYKWYADQMGVVVETGLMGFIRLLLHPPKQIASRAPLDLPSARHFPDIGWVVMHQRLGDKDGIQFMFKSSPYGSLSHSFADQNTFTLEAYGTPLAIPTGHRPWSGSNHHFQWTKTTQAHNGILVGGKGQKIQSIDAKGDLIAFLHGKSFDYTAGDAVPAYDGLLEHFVRHALYVRPDTFVIFDDLRATNPDVFSWLLHAYHEMDIDEEKGHIGIDAKTARLDVQLWSSHPLTYSQTDQYAVPLDEPMNKPPQWHLTATTTEQSADAYFQAVLKPAKPDVRTPIMAEKLSFGSGEGVLLKDRNTYTTVLFQTAEGDLAAEGLMATGRVAAWSRGSSQEQKEGALLIGGTRWTSDSGLRLTSTTEVDVELTVVSSEEKGEELVEITGTVIAPAGPGAKDFDVIIHLPKISEVVEVASGHTVRESVFENDALRLRLAPGHHELSIKMKR